MKKRTKRLILEAFNDLLKDHMIEDITINMILLKAEIGKSTFYRYFKDKYDVMSYNYDVILEDSVVSSSDLRELLYNICVRFHHMLHVRTRKNIYVYKGANSTNEYMIESSMAFLEDLTKRNRGGMGLTHAERFQCSIIIGGISATGFHWPIDENDISTFRFCANMLYEMFPESIKALKLKDT